MSKGKKLQKFTHLKNSEDVRVLLKESPESYDEVVNYLMSKVNTTYKDKLGQEHWLLDMLYECFRHKGDMNSEIELRNFTYETNHLIITATMHNFINNYETVPNMTSLAAKTGLSRTTLYKHLKEGILTDNNKLVKGKIETMALKALERLFVIGIRDDNVTALKSYIELSGVLTSSSNRNVNNYIQINNLKLTKDQFDQLPANTFIEMEKIITKTINKSNNTN